MKAKQRIKNCKGFSLGEMLITVLILMLASVIMATGMPAAKNAYEKVVIGANAKALLSTTISALQDELAIAQDVMVMPDGTTIEYYSANIGARSRLFLNTEETIRTIRLREYIDFKPGTTDPLYTDSDGTKYERNLVSSKAITDQLYVTYESAQLLPLSASTYEEIKITNLKVCLKINPSTVLASVPSLTIRFIKPSPTPTPAP